MSQDGHGDPNHLAAEASNAKHYLVMYTGIGIWRIADCKLVEHWSNIDLQGLLQQLGGIKST